MEKDLQTINNDLLDILDIIEDLLSKSSMRHHTRLREIMMQVYVLKTKVNTLQKGIN